jgi:membrane associated rhomboid family serine protease
VHVSAADEPHAIVLATENVDEVQAVRGWLDAAGVPYGSGVLPGPPPRVVVTVPASRLDEARAAIAAERREIAAAERPRFPRGPLYVSCALVLVHLALLAVTPQVFREGALVAGRTAREPWRLVTSLFLHTDVPHVLWNGLSMTTFAVPLLGEQGYLRTGLLYLAAGIGGAMTAVGFAPAGAMVVGSSGAVAGLFGAWVVGALARAREQPPTRHARLRALGVAMFVLPSFLGPVTSTGHPVSISSHLGGLATGMLIGAALSAFAR